MTLPTDRIARLAAYCFPGAEAVWVVPGRPVHPHRIDENEAVALAEVARRAGLGVAVPDVASVPTLEAFHGRLGALAALPKASGTLLLLCAEPRAFSPDDREALADLAALANALDETVGIRPPPDHVLRTPLTNLLGFADLLADRLDGEAGDYVERIRTNGRELLAVLQGEAAEEPCEAA